MSRTITKEEREALQKMARLPCGTEIMQGWYCTERIHPEGWCLVCVARNVLKGDYTPGGYCDGEPPLPQEVTELVHGFRSEVTTGRSA